MGTFYCYHTAAAYWAPCGGHGAVLSALCRGWRQMRDFLNVRRVPPSLKNKINSFYGAAARHQVLEDHDVIQHLSAPLQTELMLFLYRNTLERVPFFQVPPPPPPPP